MKRVCILSFLLLLLASVTVTAASFPEEGDHLQLGSYKGEPIVWQIVNVDPATGIGTLVSSDIIAYMAYDASESGEAGVGDTEVQQNGSNDYVESNLFQWLNSDGIRVQYSDVAPSADSVIFSEDFEGNVTESILADEAGFLNGFSDNEQSAIMETDYEVGMTEDYAIGDQPMDGTSSAGTLVTSKVFLLSIEELGDWVLGHGYTAVKRTLSGDQDYYWLRSTYSGSDSLVWTVDTGGSLFITSANYSKTGVLPVVRLDLRRYPIVTGVGTATNPYTLDYQYAIEDSALISDVSSVLMQEKVMEVKDAISKVDSFYDAEVIVRNIETDIRSQEEPIKWRIAYDTYLADAGVSLHRQLFSYDQLLRHTAQSSVTFIDKETLSIEGQEALDVLSSIGVINGYEDGSFRGLDTVSRSELSKMLVKVNQTLGQGKEVDFTDVSMDDWYYLYVSRSIKLGLVQGYEDGTFRPANSVTKDELAVIMSRLLINKYGYLASEMGDYDLTGNSDVSSWAKSAVGMMMNAEIYSGDSVYVGGSAATREEVVIYLHRVLRLINETDI